MKDTYRQWLDVRAKWREQEGDSLKPSEELASKLRASYIAMLRLVAKGKRLEGRGMPTGPKLFGDRRFTATSKVDDDGSYLPETTALRRIERVKQGRLSWEELQPRTN